MEIKSLIILNTILILLVFVCFFIQILYLHHHIKQLQGSLHEVKNIPHKILEKFAAYFFQTRSPDSFTSALLNSLDPNNHFEEKTSTSSSECTQRSGLTRFEHILSSLTGLI